MMRSRRDWDNLHTLLEHSSAAAASSPEPKRQLGQMQRLVQLNCSHLQARTSAASSVPTSKLEFNLEAAAIRRFRLFGREFADRPQPEEDQQAGGQLATVLEAAGPLASTTAAVGRQGGEDTADKAERQRKRREGVKRTRREGMQRKSRG